MKFMDAFESFANKSLVPVAAKLNAQRHIAAVRDAFILTVPLSMTGAIMVMVNAVFLSKRGQFTITNNNVLGFLADLIPLFSAINQGTVNCLSIFISFLVARNLVKAMGGDDLLAGLTSLSAFFTIYPTSWKTSGVDAAGETITGLTVNGYQTRWLTAEGLFVALIFGLIVGELFARLTKSEKLQIKLPDSVPPAVARSFMALIPIAIILLICSSINFIFNNYITSVGIHQFISDTIAAPLKGLGQSIWTVVILTFVSQLLWILGIHGPNTLSPVTSVMFTEAANENLNWVNDGGDPFNVPNKITYGLNSVFGTMGGSGATFGLLIAIFLVGKREDYKAIAKLSMGPGLFNINEPVVFGIPIVLNPIFMIPFILAPIVTILVGYGFVATKLLPFPWNTGAPWTSPPILYQFLATSHWMGIVVGILNVAIVTALYMPFVILSNKQIDTE